MLVVNGKTINHNLTPQENTFNLTIKNKYNYEPSLDGFLSNDPEYKNKIINNLVNTYYKDLLPQEHINFLKILKTYYNFIPKVCYDIGAAVLHWTRHAERVWPDSKIVIFDAFEPLKIFYNKYDHYMGVLSDTNNNQVKFYQNDEYFGGNSYYKEIGTTNVFSDDLYLLKNTRTLDSIVSEKKYDYPDLIKIDVQGAELDILKGATNVLSHTKYLLVELQHVNYNDGAPLYNITKEYLESQGWECIVEKLSDNGPDADYCFRNKNIT